MATKSNYTLIRGRRMRATRLNNCGKPVIGAASTVVTDGFISVGFTAQTTEAEVVEVINANGKVCARDPGSPQFNGYSLEITMCGVEPCLFEMLTGQKPVVDYAGDTIGFRMNSAIDASSQAFALELWLGVPGVGCDSTAVDAGSYGYILVPYISSGVIGDFTVENAALNFVISGASTKDGNGWGAGPYEVMMDNSTPAVPAVLPELLSPDDHLYVAWTGQAPPDPTATCVALAALPSIPYTGVTAGAPGSYIPANATPPANLAALKADAVIGDSGSAAPTAQWTAGQWIDLGDTSDAFWDGTAWQGGKVPAAFAASAQKSSGKSSK